MLNDVSYSTTQQCQLVKPYEGFSLYNKKKEKYLLLNFLKMFTMIDFCLVSDGLQR